MEIRLQSRGTDPLGHWDAPRRWFVQCSVLGVVHLPNELHGRGRIREQRADRVAAGLPFDGATWSLQSLPNASSAATLNGVSCTTASTCVVVGTDLRDSNRTLALVFQQGSWTTSATPNPSGDSQLWGVSCGSPTTCTAVGVVGNGDSNDAPLVERWTGSAWVVGQSTNPVGYPGDGLSGVSCTSEISCTAVGYEITSSNEEVATAEQWSGWDWTALPVQPVGGAVNSALVTVSCTSPTTCAAVGSYGTTGTSLNMTNPLAEGEDG